MKQFLVALSSGVLSIALVKHDLLGLENQNLLQNGNRDCLVCNLGRDLTKDDLCTLRVRIAIFNQHGFEFNMVFSIENCMDSST